MTWRAIHVAEACNGKDLEEEAGIWQLDPSPMNVEHKLKIGT